MLRELLIALDVRLTGNTAEEVAEFRYIGGLDLGDPIEVLVETEYRLSDGGNSRLRWNPAHGRLSLTEDSLATCKRNWHAAVPERQAVEMCLRQALYRESPELYSAV